MSRKPALNWGFVFCAIAFTIMGANAVNLHYLHSDRWIVGIGWFAMASGWLIAAFRTTDIGKLPSTRAKLLLSGIGLLGFSALCMMFNQFSLDFGMILATLVALFGFLMICLALFSKLE